MARPERCSPGDEVAPLLPSEVGEEADRRVAQDHGDEKSAVDHVVEETGLPRRKAEQAVHGRTVRGGPTEADRETVSDED